jgi:flagellar assembly factor FliW
MIIESPVLGTVEVANEKLIEFSSGLSGFEHLRRFALLHDEEDETRELFLLLSVDSPDVLFSATDPANVAVHYELRLTDEESADIGLNDPAQAAVLVILRRDDSEGAPESAGLRANFMAPIIINLETRRGLQKVMSRVDCEVTLRSL